MTRPFPGELPTSVPCLAGLTQTGSPTREEQRWPRAWRWLSGDGAGVKAGTLPEVTVGDVLADFGWSDTVDIGRIEGARELEAICIAWVKIGGTRGAWDHGFRLLVGYRARAELRGASRAGQAASECRSERLGEPVAAGGLRRVE